MDSFLARFSLFEIVGLVIPGAVAAGGVWWAFAGAPGKVGAVEALAALVFFYVVGNLLQSLTNVLESWRVPFFRGCQLPRTSRLVDPADKPFSDAFKEVLRRRLEERGWPDLEGETARVVALARAELRARKLDQRAETLLAMFFFSRGLAMASVVVGVGNAAALADGREWSRAAVAVAALVAAYLFRRRASEYDRYYADHLWSDFAAAPASRERDVGDGGPGASETDAGAGGAKARGAD